VVLQPHTAFGGTPEQFRLLTITSDGISSQRMYTMPATQFNASDREEFVKLIVGSVAASDSAMRELSRGRATANSPSEVETQVRAVVSRLGVPPAVQTAIPGADGSVWVMSLRNRHVWTVFNPAGTVAYTVRVPPDTRVMRVSLNRFWAITTDSNGLPVITRNRVAAR
jgi:hypothetical protein